MSARRKIMPCAVPHEIIEQTVKFHGHRCPGLTIGIRAAELALTRLGPADAHDLVTVAETDMCAVDAIQHLIGCTFGKGNLIHRDYGKTAFTFYDRRTGDGFRAVLRPTIGAELRGELQDLSMRIDQGVATPEECERWQALRERLQKAYLDADLMDMFIVTDPLAPVPRPVRILSSLQCEGCGEMTMESRTRRFDGKTLCMPCFEKVEQKR